ncbi:MAG: hypothetical protein ABIJ34_07000 [archaeon]
MFKKIREYNLKDRIQNIENLIYLALISAGFGIWLFIPIVPLWVKLLLTAILGLSLGNLLICIIIISIFVGDHYETKIVKLYEKYRKIVNNITILLTVVVLVIIASKIMSINLFYSVGTIFLSLVGSYLWEKIKKKVS